MLIFSVFPFNNFKNYEFIICFFSFSLKQINFQPVIPNFFFNIIGNTSNNSPTSINHTPKYHSHKQLITIPLQTRKVPNIM